MDVSAWCRQNSSRKKFRKDVATRKGWRFSVTKRKNTEEKDNILDLFSI
ncbi:hypothetical protein bcere0016_55520 [Bacillus cereus 95/8201]|nr:hypothetical protein bcere0016_55520 [Bacillus cereus 95/8201]